MQIVCDPHGSFISLSFLTLSSCRLGGLGGVLGEGGVSEHAPFSLIPPYSLIFTQCCAQPTTGRQLIDFSDILYMVIFFIPYIVHSCSNYSPACTVHLVGYSYWAYGRSELTFTFIYIFYYFLAFLLSVVCVSLLKSYRW